MPKSKSQINEHLKIFFLFFFFFVEVNWAWSQGMIVAWDNNKEPDVVGYKVYYGKASRTYSNCVDAGKVTEYKIPILPEEGVFYFAVTAYDSAGNESGYSNEVAAGNSTVPFLLGSNYPNPFNPVTFIPYSLPKKLFIKLAIYDLLGRRIKLLENGEKAAGNYQVQWDGTDERGIPVATGLYICRLVVGHFCQARKLTLRR